MNGPLEDTPSTVVVGRTVGPDLIRVDVNVERCSKKLRYLALQFFFLLFELVANCWSK